MSSYQLVGALAGFVIGDFSFGGLMQGFQVGTIAGAFLDPPKQPDQFGPRLNDLAVQTSTYGTPIPRVYGKFATHGNIFWFENNRLKEVVTKKKVKAGGKGGKKKKVTITTYSYYATFALGLCEGPIDQIARIWIGGKLFYDGSSPDRSTIIFSQRNALNFTVYNGSNTQTADTRIQAAQGTANTPGYRGVSYIVFYDLPLKEYGNSIQSLDVKVEVVSPATKSEWIRSYINTDIGMDLGSWYGTRAYSYIRSFENGLFRIGFANSTNSIQFDTYGNYINTENCDIPIIDWQDYWNGLGKMGGDDYWKFNYTDIQEIQVGPSWDRLYTVYFDGIINIDIVGFTISNDASCCIIFHNPVGASVTHWGIYDSARNYMRSGVLDRIVDQYTIGFGRLCTTHFSASSFDSKNLMLGYTYGAGSGETYVYKIYSDNVMRRVMDLKADLVNFTLPTCWLEDNVFYTFHGNHFNIFNIGHVSGVDLPLYNIISTECLKSNILTQQDIDVSDLTQIVPGYRISQVSNINNSLEPLQSAYQFDIFQRGYNIKFKNRNNSSILTIPISDLGTTIGESNNVIRMKEEIGDNLSLPTIVSVKYIDINREYDISEQRATKGTEEENILTIEMPVVITADNAAKLADTLLHLYWLEKRDFTFILPSTYWGLEVCDIVTIENTDFRLTSIIYTGEGLVECKAKVYKTGVYNSIVTGETIISDPVIITEEGPTVGILMDLPCVTSDMDKPCYAAAGTGYLPGWNGGDLYTSNDQWQTYTLLSDLSNANAVSTANNVIGSWVSTAIDYKSELNVRCIGTLSSVTIDQMLNGSNVFAYGINGRWEIIQAANCILQSNGTYTLSDLLRGRAGTEHNTGNHAINDYVIELDNSLSDIINSSTSYIGIPAVFKAVSPYQELEEASEFTFTYNGENLECLSPIYLSGNRNPSSGDWTISWIRRTRVNGEWRDFIDAPLSEYAEAYEIEITGSPGNNVYRTLTSTTNSVIYTAANQTTDFGGIIDTIFVTVYQMSQSVGRGKYLRNSVSLGGIIPPEPFFSAFNFEGPNNSTNIVDLSGKQATVTNSAYISTSQYKFGTSSLRINAQDSYIYLPSDPSYAIGTNGFTIRAFIRIDTPGGSQTIFNHGYYAEGIMFRMETSGMAFYINGWRIPASGLTISANTWYHVEASRQGNNVYLFLDGNLVASESGWPLYNIPANYMIIGTSSHSPTNEGLIGYIDDLSVYKTCLHTSSFTPPTVPTY